MYEVPTSLSPSRVSAFVSCPLAFRFSSIEKIPEPPSVHLTRGTVVHRALELFFGSGPDDRDADRLERSLEDALAEYRTHPDLVDLGLTEAEMATFERDCAALVMSYLSMEDPRRIREIGLELRLETVIDSAGPDGGLTLRGIIDRLELDDDGELVVTDYKTGRAPGPKYVQSSLASMQFYAVLCRAVLGRAPRSLRLMYLKSGEVISATPTDQSMKFLLNRTTAVWRAVERACMTGDFRPNRSGLCSGCNYRRWCPEFGGSPEAAAVEAPVVFRSTAAGVTGAGS